MIMNILCRISGCDDQRSAELIATAMIDGRVDKVTFGTSSCNVISTKSGARVSGCPANDFGGFVAGSEPLICGGWEGVRALSSDDYAPEDDTYLLVGEAVIKL